MCKILILVFISLEQVNRLLKQKEKIRLAFKKSSNALPSNLFEIICAMLNREGGVILLGVYDNGEIAGIDSDCIDMHVSHIIMRKR